MAHPPATSIQPALWSLEVVRGRAVGRLYRLNPGETTLGQASGDHLALDLSDQEGTSPRRMEPRHATINLVASELTIRDLDTPGGTFVNRQRLLSGQTRRLQPGDLIQLASVQLRVVSRADSREPAIADGMAPSSREPGTTPQPPAPEPVGAPKVVPSASAGSSAVNAARLPTPYNIGGASCRAWDDFLVLAAQRWNDLRDELTSGRLADFLERIHRPELIPRRNQDRTPDEQLDDWLGRLPASRSSAPELDVHPERLGLRAHAIGVTHHTIRVANVGYRLLRCTAHVEPTGTSWLRLRPEHDGRPFSTIEQVDLPLEVEIPEMLDEPLSAVVVLESNGGVRRVTVRIERPAEPALEPEHALSLAAPGAINGIRHITDAVARYAPGVRLGLGTLGAFTFRLLVMLSGLLPVGARQGFSVEAHLPPLAVVLAVAGAVVGALTGQKKGDRRDVLASGFAGALLGMIAAAVGYAAIRTVELPLRFMTVSFWTVELLWAALGAALAALSIVLIPQRSDGRDAGP
jgi:hypothetical protein